MAEKKFLLSENQKAWDFYYSNILDVWIEENKELQNKTFTEEEKVVYSKKIYGAILPKNITPFNYELSKKKTSVAQYKPVVIAFEQYVKKSFNDITVNDIEAFAEHTDKQSKLNHLNAFLVAGITNGYIENTDLELLISLLPKEYRKLGMMIARK